MTLSSATITLVAVVCTMVASTMGSPTTGEQHTHETRTGAPVALEPVDFVNFNVVGNTMSLQLSLGNATQQWTLQRVVNLYTPELVAAGGADPVETFEFAAPGKGWVVATIQTTGTLHGIIYADNNVQDGSDSTSSSGSVEFSHATHLHRELGATRMLREGVVDADRYYARSLSSEGFFGDCGVKDDPPVENGPGQGGLRVARSAVARSGSIITASKEVDPLVFYGAGTCFDNDDETHVFSHGVLVDQSLLDLMGSRAAAVRKVQQVVSTASAIYKYQFNVQLQIGTLLIAGDAGTKDHAVFNECAADFDKQLANVQRFGRNSGQTEGSWHLLTNCFPFTGTRAVVGKAFKNTAGCQYGSLGWNTAVSTITENLWATYAHEMGHNFGAGHSAVSGIMHSSSNPLVDGKPRFREERKTSMCQRFKTMLERKCQFFRPKTSADGDNDPNSPILPEPGTPAPTPEPTSSSSRKCKFTRASWCNAAPLCEWDEGLGSCQFAAMFRVGDGRSCRFKNKVRSSYFSTETAQTETECVAKCAGDDCVGVDFDPATLTCELWTRTPDSASDVTRKSAARVCYISAPATAARLSLDMLTGVCEGRRQNHCTKECMWSPLRESCMQKRFARIGDACRYNKKDKSKYRTRVTATSQADCLEQCGDECAAAEFHSKNRRCNLWKIMPTAAVGGRNKNCFVKTLA